MADDSTDHEAQAEEPTPNLGSASTAPPTQLPGSEPAPVGSPEPPHGYPAGRVPAPRLPTIAGYELLGELGHGGMGVVYQARDVSLGRIVALKMMRAGDLATPSEQARFKSEAEALARLKHPNIVQIYEVGLREGGSYLALEYVEGATLAQKVSGTPQPPRAAAALVEILARTIHTAHQRGIVHRDLKPSNILLQPDDAVFEKETQEYPAPAKAAICDLPSAIPKITDFGLAKRVNADAGQTRTGVIMGTPSYMAPEQAAGRTREIGPAADIYALGAILYELLTGRPPFLAESWEATRDLVLSQEPVPPRRLLPKVPRDLQTICLKCLDKQPHKRYASALELADELRRYLDGKPIQARPVGIGERLWRWTRRKPALAGVNGLVALIVVLGIVAFIGFSLFKSRLSREDQFKEAAKAFDKGIALCERGDTSHGLLWLARSLEFAPSDEADLQEAIRLNLAGWSRQVHTLTAVLPHEGEVVAVAFTPDGKAVWTASADGTAQSWDAATGQPRGAPLSFGRGILAAAFSPDCNLVATGGTSGAQLWDVSSGRLIGPRLSHKPTAETTRKKNLTPSLSPGTVHAVAFRRDGSCLVTGGDDGYARLWDTATGEGLATLDQGESVRSVTFSPDGATIVTAGARQASYLWDARTGNKLGDPLLHDEPVRAVTFSPDGSILATGSGKTAWFWNAATRTAFDLRLAHADHIGSVSFSPDRTLVLTGSDDKTGRLWNAATGMPVGAALWHGGKVRVASFSPDGKRVVTGSTDRTARVWQAASEGTLGPPLRHDHEVLSIAVSPDGEVILSGSADNKARLWETATGRCLQTLRHEDAVQAVAFSRDGKTIATASFDKTAALWERASGKRLGSFPHGDKVWDVVLSPDGRTIATASGDWTAQLWDTTTGVSRAVLKHGRPVRRVVFSGDGRTVLTASADNTARVWDAASGNLLRTLTQDDWVNTAVFSPDDQLILTGSKDKTAQVWQAATGERRGPPLPHDGAVRAVAFSPDGQTALTGAADDTAQLWDLRTGKRLAKLRHRGEVRVVAFSQDGKIALTGSYDHTVRLWQVPSGKPLGPPLAHQARVSALILGHDGKTIVTGSLDQTVRRWPMPEPAQGSAKRAVLWAQTTLGMELEDRGTARVIDSPTWHERRQALAELAGAPTP